MFRNDGGSDNQGSVDSTGQTGQSDGADWQEEAYQKVKAMKEMYLPDIKEMHQKVSLKLQHQASLIQMSEERIDMLKLMKAFLERVLTFLHLPKGSIPIGHRDKMSIYEKQIVHFLNTNRQRRPVPPLQGQEQLQPSGGQTLFMTHQQQPQSHIPQLQQHDDQMQPVNISNSAASSATTMSHSSFPLAHHLGVQPTQSNMINSLQLSSNFETGQANAPGSLQKAVMGHRQHNTVITSQQTNLKSGVSTLQANMNSLQMNSYVLQQQHLKQQQDLQLLQSQLLMHHVHPHQMHQLLIKKQQEQQQAAQFQAQQMPQLQQMSDDMKMREGMGFKPGMIPPHPTGSTAQPPESNGADWEEEAYQKVKAMKEMYLPDLKGMHEKVSLKLQHQDSLLQMSKENIDRLKAMKGFLERVLTFLQMPKGSIQIAHRDKMSNYEKQIVTFLNTNRGRRPIPSHQGQQQLQPSVGQTQQQQPQSQIPQLQQHDNQV